MLVETILNRVCVCSSGVISAGRNYEIGNMIDYINHYEKISINNKDIFDAFKLYLGVDLVKNKSKYVQNGLEIKEKYFNAYKLILSSNIEDKAIDLEKGVEDALNTLKLTGTTVRRHKCFVFDEDSLQKVIIFRKMLED